MVVSSSPACKSRAPVELVRAALPARHTTGALQGLKDRAWVICRIAGLNFQATLIAIIADTTSLALPPEHLRCGKTGSSAEAAAA
jgi:hypothetical protein